MIYIMDYYCLPSYVIRCMYAECIGWSFPEFHGHVDKMDNPSGPGRMSTNDPGLTRWCLRDKVRLEVQRYPEEPKPWTVFRRVWEETIQTYPVIQRITGYIHDTQIGKLSNVCRSCILIVVTKIAKRRGVELPNSYSTLNNRRVLYKHH